MRNKAKQTKLSKAAGEVQIHLLRTVCRFQREQGQATTHVRFAVWRLNNFDVLDNSTVCSTSHVLKNIL